MRLYSICDWFSLPAHTDDNSFLGFAVTEPKGPGRPKENLGVLYGKDSQYFKVINIYGDYSHKILVQFDEAEAMRIIGMSVGAVVV